MNKTRIIGGVGLGLVGLTAVAAAALPSIVQGRLAGWIDAAAESAVNADVSVGSVEVAVWKTFPQAQLTLRDLVVSGREPFVGVDLATVPEVRLGVDLMSAISGSTLTVESVQVDRATVHVVYDREGRANWDVMPETTSSADPYHLRLDDVQIADLAVRFEDRASYLVTEIDDIDLRLRADLTHAVAKVQTTGAIESLTVRYGGVTWLQATKWKTDMKVDYNQETGEIAFGENTIRVNALPLSFSGKVAPSGEDDWDLDLSFEATETGFGSLLSLVPDAYGDSFAGLDASGTISLQGRVKGIYDSDSDDLPAFGTELQIEKARFNYPDAPGSVDGVAAQLVIDHPGGPLDAVRVRAEHFSLSSMGSTVTGRFRLAHPLSDPDLDLMMDGRVNLGALRKALPQAADAPEVDGTLAVDFTVQGRMSDFEAQRLERVKASGTVRGRGLRMRYAEQPVEVERLDLALAPDRVTVNELAVRSKGSDVNLAGRIDNALPWMLSDTAVLGGALTVSGKRIDLRPFQGDDESAAGEADDGLLVAVPANVDMRMELRADRLISEDLTMDAVVGKVHVANQTATLDSLRGDTLGGRVKMSGSYRAPTEEQADVDLTLETVRVDLEQTLRAFETLGLIAPVLQRARGEFDSNFSLKTTLARDGSPDLSKVSSTGLLAPLGMDLRAPVLQAVADKLAPGLESLSLAGANVAYAFDDGVVELRPFKAKLGPQQTTVSGSFGPLDRSLDLTLALPVSTKDLSGSPLVASLGAALPKTADVEVRIRGTFDKPTVAVGLKGQAAEELLDAALNPLVAAAMAQGDKLLAEARVAADKLLAEAAKGAEKVLTEARSQGRKLRKEAKGNPLKEAAADKAANLLVSEAEKQTKKALREADKGADSLVDLARKKRDKLVEDARAEAKAAATGR